MNYPALWRNAIETKDLHSEDGAAIWELMGYVSNQPIPWNKSCLMQLEMIQDIAKRLPSIKR